MEFPLKLTFLGTGSVKGRPVYGCCCETCMDATMDPFMQRRPASALLEFDGMKVLLDAGLTDLQERFPPGTLNHILLTHFHLDHVMGLLSLRWGEDLSIPVTAPDDTVADLHKHRGILEFSQPITSFEQRMLGSVRITALPLTHSKPAMGYYISYGKKHLAYLTDTDGLPENTLDYLCQQPPNVMVIDCSYPPAVVEKSGSHNDLNQVIELHRKIRPGRTLLTHIGHELDNWLDEQGNHLPADIEPANDGLVITL